MPLSAKQKADTLQVLHLFFNRTDDHLVEPGRSADFSEQVKSDIAEIIKHGSHKNIEKWGDRCFKARESNCYLYDHVAELLNVSRKAIQTQEKLNEPTDVDPFYLEAFSLIYRVNPYDLLGIPNPHLCCPFASLDDKNQKYCSVIINSLYDENDPDKLEYLETIITIGKLKLEKYKQLMSFLKSTASFANDFDTNPLDSPAANDNQWMGTPLPTASVVAQYDSKTYRLKHLYWETRLVLKDLEDHNPARLYTLAQLTLCDTNVAKALKYLIFELGYPKDPKSLNKYPVKNILNKPLKRKKHSTKKVDPKYKITEKCEEVFYPMRDIIYYFPQFPITDTCDGDQALTYNNIAYSVVRGYSAVLSGVLQNLSYVKSDQSPEYKPVSHNLPDYRINLLDRFVDGEKGQAILTNEQCSRIREIVEALPKRPILVRE